MTAPARLPLRVIIAHNEYQQRGGEDAVVEAESALLLAAGHQVLRYRRHNDEVSRVGKLALLRQTIWSPVTERDMADAIRSFAPNVIHVHNTLPLISPSIYRAATRARVPVVQTLHNFRIVCPQAQLRRTGSQCQACVGHVPWRAVVHKCYRQSYAQSAALALTQQLHASMGTWRDHVTRYIALSRFCEDIFVAGGIPRARIRIKPNYVPDRSAPPDQPETQEPGGLLFVGRLTEEKGVRVLARALGQAAALRCKVAGDGPAAAELASLPNVAMLGALSPDQVAQQMRRAYALVVPSVCPEMFGLVVIEAFAAGLAVIASRIGALAELVEHGVTGLLVNPDDAGALADAMTWAADNKESMAEMGRTARQRYLSNYTMEANRNTLESIYHEAISGNEARQ